ncbi:MAG: ribosome-binding factor A, partial [Acidobacteria bacterium]
RAAGFLRREVGRRCGLRYAPELFFEADRSYDRGARIDELLSRVLPESEEEP